MRGPLKPKEGWGVLWACLNPGHAPLGPAQEGAGSLWLGLSEEQLLLRLPPPPPGGAAGAGAAPGGRPRVVPCPLPPPLQGSHRDDAAAGVRDEGPSAPPLDPPRATRIVRDPPQHRSGPPGVPQLRTGLDFPVGPPFRTLLGSLWGSPGPLLFPPRPLFPPSTSPPVLPSALPPLPHLFWYETPQ
ncbi:hypothetical protein DV515_00019599 [Chloebia gouldiae]|uniref:Uncharacterized protein n=1 Tax=Chloebia gouldiae TaxID=44316 RepID=A0A3L8Q4D8_CHLGU|nr:hypothetical protein DV515_00019599 [Chloebia gouldiae]